MNSILGTGFKYSIEARLPCGKVIAFEDHNLLPQVAVNHNAGLIRGTVAPISAWYVGLFEGDFVPNGATSAADLPGLVGEFTGYNEATRRPGEHDYDGVSIIDNAADRAVFTFTTNKIIHGAFICSSPAKGSASGVLLSIARFAVPRDLPAGTEFAVTVGITLVPTA